MSNMPPKKPHTSSVKANSLTAASAAQHHREQAVKISRDRREKLLGNKRASQAEFNVDVTDYDVSEALDLLQHPLVLFIILFSWYVISRISIS